MATVALDNGKWFDSTDADQWASGDGDTLFHVGDVWAVRSLLDVLGNQPALLVDPAGAVHWLARHGMAIPDILKDAGNSTRIEQS